MQLIWPIWCVLKYVCGWIIIFKSMNAYIPKPNLVLYRQFQNDNHGKSRRIKVFTVRVKVWKHKASRTCPSGAAWGAPARPWSRGARPRPPPSTRRSTRARSRSAPPAPPAAAWRPRKLSTTTAATRTARIMVSDYYCSLQKPAAATREASQPTLPPTLPRSCSYLTDHRDTARLESSIIAVIFRLFETITVKWFMDLHISLSLSFLDRNT